MQQKTIFLNIYKTIDYFFDLIIKTKYHNMCTIYLFLRNSRNSLPDVFLKKDTA